MPPSNNRYRKRKRRETAAGGETEGENRETKETDRYRDGERQRKTEDVALVVRVAGGAGEGGSWHLTVKHAFLMSALVLRIPILRSQHHAEPGKHGEERRDEKVKGWG